MARTCFDIGHCAIKVKVTVGILKFSAFTLLPKYIDINI